MTEVARDGVLPCFRLRGSGLPTALAWLVLACVLWAPACGSSQPSTIYQPSCAFGERPSLRDGEIRMTTRWTNASDETPDVRVVACNDGQLTCWFEGPNGRREGYVTEADWNWLWSRLEPVSPWAQTSPTVKPQDPTGGPYHLIHLRAGTSVSQFSSQHRADLLVFTSREAAQRLEYSNVIVDFVGARARNPVEVPPPESRPLTPAPSRTP
jgi:hypothetical protein